MLSFQNTYFLECPLNGWYCRQHNSCIVISFLRFNIFELKNLVFKNKKTHPIFSVSLTSWSLLPGVSDKVFLSGLSCFLMRCNFNDINFIQKICFKKAVLVRVENFLGFVVETYSITCVLHSKTCLKSATQAIWRLTFWSGSIKNFFKFLVIAKSRTTSLTTITEISFIFVLCFVA